VNITNGLWAFNRGALDSTDLACAHPEVLSGRRPVRCHGCVRRPSSGVLHCRIDLRRLPDAFASIAHALETKARDSDKTTVPEPAFANRGTGRRCNESLVLRNRRSAETRRMPDAGRPYGWAHQLPGRVLLPSAAISAPASRLRTGPCGRSGAGKSAATLCAGPIRRLSFNSERTHVPTRHPGLGGSDLFRAIDHENLAFAGRESPGDDRAVVVAMLRGR
jgi:hypothetical protein